MESNGEHEEEEEFHVNMDSIDLAIYLKQKGLPSEVCDALESKWLTINLLCLGYSHKYVLAP